MAKSRSKKNRYAIWRYSHERLTKLLAQNAGADLSVIENKPHCARFKEYFSRVPVSTIIVEEDYVDHHFLDDFTGYYVSCYKPYERWCTRLHFFGEKISEETFQAILERSIGKEELSHYSESYLGFIVVKPLPRTIFGRTCLKTVPVDAVGRRYPITRRYKANLFGWDLEVNSLAFLEQDKVVGACSTSALWSVLQGTGVTFHHHIPTPVEITRSATLYIPPIPPETRHFPNNGLTVPHMAQAIKQVDLVPFYVSPKTAGFQRVADYLKAIIYGYLEGRIPILMTFQLVEYCEGEEPRIHDGIHAVAITGYLPDKEEAIPLKRKADEPGCLLRASRISRLYVHDDQIGPFTRMDFSPEDREYILPKELAEGYDYSLSTSWFCAGRKPGFVRAVPLALMIPLYCKIRIDYATVLKAVVSLDAIIERLRRKGRTTLSRQLEWDIHLITLNDYKTQLADRKDLDWKVRREALTQGMPRFIWKATAFSGKDTVIELLFDATDIEQSCILFHAVPYSSNVYELLEHVSKDPNSVKWAKTIMAWKILEWFSKLKKKKEPKGP